LKGIDFTHLALNRDKSRGVVNIVNREPSGSIISGEFLDQPSDYFREEFCKKESVAVKVEEQCHQERKPKKS
jgi:hypothetical protein